MHIDNIQPGLGDKVPVDQFEGEPIANPFRIDLRGLWNIVRRNLALVAIVVAAALVLGLVVTMLMTPQYRAEASVQVEQQTDRVLSSEEVEPVAAYQDADRFLETQTDILESRNMATRVAQALNLFGNAEFYQAMGAELPDQDGVRRPDALERDYTIGLIADNLEIVLPVNSRIISIAFTSPDPALSARIANAYAQEYIKNNLQRRYDSSSYARDFLSRQLAEAKARLETSERDLNNYARSVGIVRTSEGSAPEGSDSAQSVTTASLVQLNEAANVARIARIEAEQKWRTIARIPLTSIPDVLGNQAVQRLYEQRAVLSAALQQERAKHRDSHPTVIQLQAQLNETNEQVGTLASSIKSSVEQEYRAALAREESLLAQVNASKDATLAEQDQGVRYNILAREADTNRTLYDGLLQRFNEVSAAAGITSNNISILDDAEQPIEPVSPRLILNIALAFLAGIGLAAAAVFAREHIDDAIRAPEDVEGKLGLRLLGVIPIMKDGVTVEVLQDPRSPVAEAYNALRTSILYASPSGAPKVLFFTSASASEGKSTTTFAIASGLARLGRSVALIDADLRRPAMHLLIGTPNGAGLTDLLASETPVDQVMHRTDLDGLSFISAGPIPPSPTELLGTTKLSAMIARLREKFDHVIIDGPPVLGLADAPILSAVTDATVFVIEANRGHRGATKSAIRRLRQASGTIVGAVLTKFDSRKTLSGYDYYGDNYYEYSAERE